MRAWWPEDRMVATARDKLCEENTDCQQLAEGEPTGKCLLLTCSNPAIISIPSTSSAINGLVWLVAKNSSLPARNPPPSVPINRTSPATAPSAPCNKLGNSALPLGCSCNTLHSVLSASDSAELSGSAGSGPTSASSVNLDEEANASGTSPQAGASVRAGRAVAIRLSPP